MEINDLGYIDDYVYDLETDVGHFHAGFGSLIVKNTDSVFFSPKIHNIKTKQIMTNKACLRVSIELGILAGEVIGKILPEPEDLEYEKTFWPFIILTKKRYVGNLYETDFESFKQKGYNCYYYSKKQSQLFPYENKTYLTNTKEYFGKIEYINNYIFIHELNKTIKSIELINASILEKSK